jgi:hypothetical protein
MRIYDSYEEVHGLHVSGRVENDMARLCQTCSVAVFALKSTSLPWKFAYKTRIYEALT